MARARKDGAFKATSGTGSSIKEFYGLEFDGASKGNPGQAGAGALIRNPDGSVLCELKKGLGIATCNFAEYFALIIGLQAALNEGIRHIKVQGDSKLVCKQVMGDWQVHSKSLKPVFLRTIQLTEKFQSFSIQHVYRTSNKDADALANAATELPVDKLVSSSRSSIVRMAASTADETQTYEKCKIINGMEGTKFGPSCNKGVPKQMGNAPYSSDKEKQNIFQLEFHGATKGIPGKAGVGALLRQLDGGVHFEYRQGLGTMTRNAAHYHALIFGLRMALDHGVFDINVQGDSDLVFKQIMGKCKTKNKSLQSLWTEANDLLKRFTRITVSQVTKEENAAACALAEAAIRLPDDGLGGVDLRTSGVLPMTAAKLAVFQSDIKLLPTGGQLIKPLVTNKLHAISFTSRDIPCRSLVKNQVYWSHRLPQALSYSFSNAMPKCKYLPLSMGNKSLPRIVRTLVPAMGAVLRTP